MQTVKNPLIILAGNSHPDLARLITERMGVTQGEMTVYNQANRDTVVEIKESVRGKDVYIIQTGTKDVNNDIMELLIIAYACMASSSRRIVGVIPYLPYSKQSKMRKRGCIVSKLIANMLCKSGSQLPEDVRQLRTSLYPDRSHAIAMGLSHIITMDIQQKEIQGFFDIPVDNLRASPFLIEYIINSIPDYRNSVIVARNANSVKRATSFAERLRLSIAVIHGEERSQGQEGADGRQSPPLPEVEQRRIQQGIEMIPRLQAKEKPPIHIVGDVGGKIAIIVDCLVDDVMSFVNVAGALKERGAYKIYVMATHGLLTSDAPRLIENSAIDEVVVTNTVPHEIQKMQCHKIKTVDISIMLSEAIRRIHYGESMSYLFKNIGLDD